MTTTSSTTVVIRNQPNNTLTRFPCGLCGGSTEKQSYLFVEDLTDTIVCDECAEHPESIPERVREHAASLRTEANNLEALARQTFVTEVVRVSPDVMVYDKGGDLGTVAELAELYEYEPESEFPDWMRERLRLSPRCAETS